MGRKPITDETQLSVLTKSRRRCCLCFWLQGTDEVMKGQIAHIDQDNENADEDNLVFLCLNHHDEYDGRTSQSKGLKADEVRHYRDMLYQEMEYKFRTRQRIGFDLKCTGVRWIGPSGECTARFKLKNTGETTVSKAVVSLCLPANVSGEKPKKRRVEPGGWTVHVPSVDFDLWGMSESREDFFEPNGRVGMISPLHPMHTLPPDHTVEFYGLGFDVTQQGAGFEVEYRIDAADQAPVRGKVMIAMPATKKDFLLDD